MEGRYRNNNNSYYSFNNNESRSTIRGLNSSSLTRSNNNNNSVQMQMSSLSSSMGSMPVQRYFVPLKDHDIENDTKQDLDAKDNNNSNDKDPLEHFMDFGASIRSSMRVRPPSSSSTDKLTFFSYDIVPTACESFSSTIPPSIDKEDSLDNNINKEGKQVIATPWGVGKGRHQNVLPTTPSAHQVHRLGNPQKVQKNKSYYSSRKGPSSSGLLLADLPIGPGWGQHKNDDHDHDGDNDIPKEERGHKTERKQVQNKTSSTGSSHPLLASTNHPRTASAKMMAAGPSIIGRCFTKSTSNKPPWQGKKKADTFSTTFSDLVLPSRIPPPSSEVPSFSPSSGSYGSSSVLPPNLPKELLKKLERLLGEEEGRVIKVITPGSALGLVSGDGRSCGLINRKETLRRLRAAHQILEAELEKFHVVDGKYVVRL